MIELIIIFIGVVLDQLTKMWASGALPNVGDSMAALPGIFSFERINNTGAAFGVLGDSTLALTIFSVLAIIVLFYVLYKYRGELGWFGRIGLALIIAGGIGNFIDRAFMGYVVDFICFDFMDFPRFNVADCWATVGTVAVIVALLLDAKKTKGEQKDGETEGNEDAAGADCGCAECQSSGRAGQVPGAADPEGEETGTADGQPEED
ncbi:MAG: signal peptidase II [Christensenellaceae bacterium]|nr:signal peptidase II [Christensenellaceae bacterium]